MTHRYMQSWLASIWILGLMIVVATAGHLRSMGDGLTLALFAVVPPATMWLWWADPAEASGQPVQTVHGNGTGRRPRL